jgi:hypothetical protein
LVVLSFGYQKYPGFDSNLYGCHCCYGRKDQGKLLAFPLTVRRGNENRFHILERGPKEVGSRCKVKCYLGRLKKY